MSMRAVLKIARPGRPDIPRSAPMVIVQPHSSRSHRSRSPYCAGRHPAAHVKWLLRVGSPDPRPGRWCCGSPGVESRPATLRPHRHGACPTLCTSGFPVGGDYPGWLTHDGWRAYYSFLRAGHQSCLGHLLRRCENLIKIASPPAARFPLQGKPCCSKPWPCGIATVSTTSPCTAYGPRPDVWKPNWIVCWPTRWRCGQS
jgi:Transposase IS66 family